MPTENSPGFRGDRATFPTLREEIGEDPARFLDVPLLASAGASTPFGLARARIRGIDRIATAKAWIAVERALARGDEGPRDRVIQLLEDRIDVLEEHGERPTADEIRAIAEHVRADHPEWAETPDVELGTWQERVGIPTWERSDPDVEADADVDEVTA